jgi:hypothetical protein
VAAPDLPGRLRWLPTALLVGGIAVSGFRIVAYDDDPQRSTAFAMFATVDIAANRRVLVTVPDKPTVLLEIPDDLQDERRQLQVVPTEEEARHFAALLQDADPELTDVRVQVVGPDTDGRTITRHVLVDIVRPGP